VLILICAKCFAQYPFEKLQARKVDSVPFKVFAFKNNPASIAVAQYQNYKVKLLGNPLKDGSNVLLYFQGKLIKKAVAVFRFDNGVLAELSQLYVYSQNDEKVFFIYYPNMDGSGLAGSLIGRLYLAGNSDNIFKVIRFGDFYNKPKFQYAFKSDSTFEIVVKSYKIYGNDAYWLFDLYNIINGKLVNVSARYGYPIAVPYLYKESFKPTHKIANKDLQRLSLHLPDFYDTH